MATLRSYSATFEHADFAQAAVTRLRFNEDAGATTALDSVDGLDGEYRAGAEAGEAGTIGDGAARFDGASGIVLVETLSGTITVSAFGDSLMDGDGFQPAARQFSPVLEAALEARGLAATVLERAEGGQRTGDALNPREPRFFTVAEVTADHPDVVILELGTNDALVQVNPATVESNLRSIIGQLQGAGVEQILLAGAFGFYPDRPAGSVAGYATEAGRQALEGIYAEIAGDTAGVTLLNDVDGSDKFLGGTRDPGDPANPTDDTIEGGVLDSTDTGLQFGDGLHPDSDGIGFIVPRVVPQTIALGAAAGVVNEPLLLANGSFELWFTADSVAGDHTLVAKNSAGQGTGGQFAILIRNGGRAVFALGDEQANFAAQSGAGVVAANAPVHLVATFGADGMHLFVNGVEVGSNAYPGGLDAGLGNFELLVVGADSGAGTPGTADTLVSFFDGLIDEFAVYDRALTAAEVQQLFDAGASGATVLGTAQSDTLIGGSDDEDLRGMAGDDVADGGGGDDDLRGGGGDDDLQGATGNDRLLGGAGADDLRGGPGDDQADGMGGRDRISGGGGNDLLEGGAGSDTLGGTGGADELFGGAGVDALSGGAGEDLLNGGAGRDSLTGGPGSDTFQIDRINHGPDAIRGFADGSGGDVLDLSAVLDFGGADQARDFVRLRETDDGTRVEVDSDGSGGDFSAVFDLLGVTGLDLGTLVADGNVRLEPAPAS